jgi:hypothetical protein
MKRTRVEEVGWMTERLACGDSGGVYGCIEHTIVRLTQHERVLIM